jgi:TonB family protein
MMSNPSLTIMLRAKLTSQLSRQRRNYVNHIKTILFVFALAACVSLAALSTSIQAHTSLGTAQKSGDEHKGEVDLLLKDLKEHNQTVHEGCLENCQEASSTKGPKAPAVEIINKAQPVYPPIARAAHASGQVIVMVVFDEEGKVIAAQVVSGHPLLQAASVKAAKETTFEPYLVNGKPVKVTGTIVYNFTL